MPQEVTAQTASTIGPDMARKARSDADKAHDLALGRTIAKLRKDRGFTQVELAQKLDLTQAIVSDYERGRLRPHPGILSRLASALQVSADELLGLRPVQKAGAYDRRFLRRLQAIAKLPKRDQDALLRTIDAFLGNRKAS
jgi:transcriptional regulator with XRE-family HTH domain